MKINGQVKHIRDGSLFRIIQFMSFVDIDIIIILLFTHVNANSIHFGFNSFLNAIGIENIQRSNKKHQHFKQKQYSKLNVTLVKKL